jgi:hypothetical protein
VLARATLALLDSTLAGVTTLALEEELLSLTTAQATN